MLLETVPMHPNPKLSLEQYTIPVKVAVEMLFIADTIFDDIRSKNIAELGCGTGRLSVGAALLGASNVVAIDIDIESIYFLQKTVDKMKLKEKVKFLNVDIDAVKGEFDTVLQNPPFGIKKRGADRPFITKALEISRVIYSLHKSDNGNRYFIKKLVEKKKGRITHIFEMKMKIPHIFPYHRKKMYRFNVDLYRMISHVK